MANNNTITLIGNLGSEAEAFTSKNGKAFRRLSIATTDSFKDESGTWQQKDAVWHSVFIFGKEAQKHADFYLKGQRVKIIGSLSYIEKEGFSDNGEPRTFREAVILAHHIEPAPLPKKA